MAYDEKKILSLLGKNITQGENLQNLEAMRWILGLMAYNGIFLESSDLMLDISIGNKYMVDNRLLPKIRRQVADYISARIDFSVVPNSSEEEDVKAARVSEKVLQHFFSTQEMVKKKRLMGIWLAATGNMFVSDEWNKSIGPIFLNPDTDEVSYLGDVDINLWSPFEVLKPVGDNGVSDIYDLDWIILRKWISVDSYWRMYREELSPGTMPTWLSLMRSLSGETSTQDNGNMIYRFFLKPTKEFPKGLYAVTTDTKVIEQSDYPFDRFPVVHFKDMEVPGRFWGRSIVSYALGLQERFSRTMEHVDAYNEYVGDGKVLNPRGSQITVNPVANTKMSILDYTPIMGQAPREMQFRGLPETFPMTLDLIAKSLDDMFAQHLATQGRHASDLRSGRMVDLLREQDAINNIPTNALANEGFQILGKSVLKRIQTGYDTERTIKIVGRDQNWEVESFKGSDLRGQDDVKVSIEAARPDTREMRRVEVLDNLQKGLYGDPRLPDTRRIALSLMEDAVATDLYGSYRTDESVAKKENELLFKNEIDSITANLYDDPVIHIKEHEEFQKESRFQQLKFDNPELFVELTAKFGEHVSQHKAVLAELMAQQQAQQQGG